jgi:peptidoglycan-associated lipoprotein
MRPLHARSAVALALLATTPVAAQDADSLRALYRVELPPIIYVAATASRTAPGSAAASPTAYGANWGDGFVGVGGQARTRFSDETRPDGSAVIGFGLGNSRDHLGVEVALTSLSTFRQGFGNNYAASFKIHRALPRNFGIAAGWENAIHNAGTDGGRSVYGVVSTVVQIRDKATDPLSTLTLSLGAGDGRFRSENQIARDENAIGVFGSAGLRVFEWASLIADWTGQDLVAGTSIVPFIRVPLIFTIGVADITRRAGDGPRLTGGVGMGFRFSGLGRALGIIPREERTAPVSYPAPARPAPRPPEPATPAPSPGPAVPFDEALLTTNIYFDFDRSELRPDARTTLEAKVPIFLAYLDFAIRIEGHADERGADEYNLALAQRRAQEARDYLISRSVQPHRIYIVSFGEERPVCRESTEPCWQLNRRAEFKIGVRDQ